MANDPPGSGARAVPGRGSTITISSATRRLLVLVTAVGLGVDAFVHWHLAPNFDTLTGAASPNISQGSLFRVESVMAVIAIALLFATRRRFAALVAFLVAAGGLAAVLFFAFADVGGLGPLPDMYDPDWYLEKSISALSQAVAAAAALALLLLPSEASD